MRKTGKNSVCTGYGSGSETSLNTVVHENIKIYIMNQYHMGKNCPLKKNGVPQTDPTNGKLFRSQRSPLNVISTDSVKRTYVSV